MPRGEHAPLAPGVVRVRLQGDSAADAIAGILRDHPAVEVLTGPDRYDGGRQYLMVRVRHAGSAGSSGSEPAAGQ
jgi:hypothetical protein